MAVGLVGPYNAVKSQTTSKTITTFADVGVANAGVMYGTSVAVYRQSEIRLCLQRCLQALRENHFADPAAAGGYVVATLPIDQGKGQVVISSEIAAGIPVEANVSVAYQGTFDNVPHSSLNLDVTVENLIDELLKDVLSAA